jgi:hypothetical protein
MRTSPPFYAPLAYAEYGDGAGRDRTAFRVVDIKNDVDYRRTVIMGNLQVKLVVVDIGGQNGTYEDDQMLQ